MITLIIDTEVSSDGTKLVLKDLTPLEDYTTNGIDVDMDIVSVTFTLTDSDSNDYTLDVTAAFPTYIRDVNGYEITTDALSYGSTFFADGVYTSTLDIVENSTGVDTTISGETGNIFLSQILQIMTSQLIDDDWKELYNPHNQSPTSDLRKRLLYINIIYSAEAGLIDEADRLRLSLNKLCSYA